MSNTIATTAAALAAEFYPVDYAPTVPALLPRREWVIKAAALQREYDAGWAGYADALAWATGWKAATAPTVQGEAAISVAIDAVKVKARRTRKVKRDAA